MKTDPEIPRQLNGVLRVLLTAINQYFLHARMFRNWGLGKLNEQEYHASIEVMKHADKVIERVLFLEGLPNLQDLGALRIGENVPECLKADLALEADLRGVLRDAIAAFEQAQDFISRELLEHLLDDCEERIDWLETQEWLIGNAGIENYLQSHIQG